ncbi:ERAD-associated protein [Irineochytrium annulatum]|nr:ERAD-associated protein [Irineochytrium annulatum]
MVVRGDDPVSPDDMDDETELPEPNLPPPPPPPGQDIVNEAVAALDHLEQLSSAQSASANVASTGRDLVSMMSDFMESVLGSVLPKSLLRSDDPEFLWSESKEEDDKDVDADSDDLAMGEDNGQGSLEVVSIERSDPPGLKKAKAVTMLEFAAAQYANPNALMLLGDMRLVSDSFEVVTFVDGMNQMKKYGVKRNVTAAFSYYHTLARKHGNATAQRMVGLMYATGVGVHRDYSRALLFMSFAALGRDDIAEQTLGYWNLAGVGVAKSCEDAAFYYKQVADKVIDLYKQGPPGGLTMPAIKARLAEEHGGLYGHGASGAGMPHSNHHSALSAQAVREIYELQADEGSQSHQLQVGLHYYQGSQHTPQNFKKAHDYFYKAAKAYGDLNKQWNTKDESKNAKAYSAIASGYIGMMYWRGEGVEQDNTTARLFFEAGEKLENAMSMNALGMMHLEGVAGFEKNFQKAFQYFTEAAQRDNADAQVNLAELILRSNKKDSHASAFKHYLAAASRPPAHIMALYRVGEMNVNGLGTAPNCMVGVGYLKTVVERGSDWLADKLTVKEAERLYRAGDVESALLLYLLAAERGGEVSQSNAAWMLDKGVVGPAGLRRVYGRTVDPYESAIVLWNRAANQANVDARVRVGDYYYYGLGGRVGYRRKTKPDKVVSEEAATMVATDVFSSVPADAKEIPAALEGAKSRDGLNPAWALVHDLGNTIIRYLPKPFLHGAVQTKPDFEMAAVYYQVASDEFSALAQWNLGYMHENGIGVAKDYHLAKRMYDLSLATNADAYLPVNLALFNLFIKSTGATFSRFIDAFTSGRLLRSLVAFVTAIIRGEDADLFQAIMEPLNGLRPPAGPARVNRPDTPAGGAPGVAQADRQHIPGQIPAVAPLGDDEGNGMTVWAGVWLELVVVSALAALASVLFLWRQLIAPRNDAVRVRVAAAAAVGAGLAAPPVAPNNGFVRDRVAEHAVGRDEGDMR